MRNEHKIPLNGWYAVAWASEVGESLTERVICDMPMVFFRKKDGTVAALENVCPHRLAPLSLGFIKNDRIVCGYHGMEFGANGECLKMPGPGDIAAPKSACVREFPVIERYNLIWLWPGEAKLADDSKVPDLHWLTDNEWVSTQNGYLQVKCDYRLVLDNLMDLTHETFVHTDTVGQEEILGAEFEVETFDDCVVLSRWMINLQAPKFFYDFFKREKNLSPEEVDRWQRIKFVLPSVVTIDVGVAATGTGAPEGDRSQGITGCVMNAITPGENGDAHYFYAFARDYLCNDAEITERLSSMQTYVFKQDQRVLEEQQKNIDRFQSYKLKNFSIDKGSVHVRRLIERAAHPAENSRLTRPPR